MKKSFFFAAAMLVVSASPATLNAGIMNPDIPVYVYTDFAENRGQFYAGATNVEIYRYDSENNPILVGTIATVPNFDSVVDNLYGGLIKPQQIATVAHLGSYNPTFTKRFIGAADSTVYNWVDHVNGQGDVHTFRLNKVVTESLALPAATRDILERVTRDSLLVRIGGGYQRLATGYGTEVPASRQEILGNYTGAGTVINAGGDYGYATAGTTYHSTFGHTGNYDETGYYGVQITAYPVSETDPLNIGTQAGDSGSPSYIYDSLTGQWYFAAANSAGGGGPGYGKNSYLRTSPELFENFANSYTDPVVAPSTSETINWNGDGTLTQNSNTWNYNGLYKDESGAQIWAWAAGEVDRYGNVSQTQVATREQLAGTHDLIFASIGASDSVAIELQDNVELGAGSITIQEAAKYTIRSAAGENFRLNSAGFIVEKDAVLTTEYSGVAGDEWRKIGEGDWIVAGTGNNDAALNLGGSGKVILQREDGYAANHILINGGGVEVVLNGENQLRTTLNGEPTEIPSVKFGFRGGNLNLNGYDVTWNEIHQVAGTLEDSGTIYDIEWDRGARISNGNSEKESVFTFTGAGEISFTSGYNGQLTVSTEHTFAGGFFGNLRIVYNSSDSASNWHWTGTTNTTNDVEIKSGNLSIHGSYTQHAIQSFKYINYDDHHFADVSVETFYVKSGTSLTIGKHARVNGNVDVENGASLLLTSGSDKAYEYIDGSNFATQITDEMHQFTGDVSLHGNASYTADIGEGLSRTHSGDIAGEIDSVFTKNGAGTLSMTNVSGANFFGTVNLNAGTLKLSENAEFDPFTNWRGTGGTVEFSGAGTHYFNDATGTFSVTGKASEIYYSTAETRTAGTGFRGKFDLNIGVSVAHTLTLENNSSSVLGETRIFLGSDSGLTLKNYKWSIENESSLSVEMEPAHSRGILTLASGGEFSNAGTFSTSEETLLKFDGGTFSASSGSTAEIASNIFITENGGNLNFALANGDHSSEGALVSFSGAFDARTVEKTLSVRITNKHELSSGTWILLDAGTLSDLVLVADSTGTARGDLIISKSNNNVFTGTLTGAGSIDVSWNSTLASNTWDLGATANWTSAENGTDKFFQYDKAIFGDVASSETNQGITLAKDITVGSLAINAETNNYTFSENAIFSDNDIAKSGAGTATFNSDISGIRGDIRVSGGRLEVAHTNGIGNANVWEAGRTLEISGANAVLALQKSSFTAASGSNVIIDNGGEFSIGGNAEFAAETLTFGTGTLRTGGDLTFKSVAAFQTGHDVFVGGTLSFYGDLVIDGGNVSAKNLDHTTNVISIKNGSLTATEGLTGQRITIVDGNLTAKANFVVTQNLDVYGNSTINAADYLVEIQTNTTLAGTEHSFREIRQSDNNTLNLGDGTTRGVTNTVNYVGSDSSKDTSIVNVNANHTFNVTGTGYGYGNAGLALILANWATGNPTTVNVLGTLNVLNAPGISYKEGRGIVNVENGGTFNIKKLDSAANKTAVNLKDGGRINVETGIGTEFEFNVSGGTIGTLSATAWSTSRDFDFTGSFAVDTEVQAANTTALGGSTATGTAGKITLSGALTGTGSFTKDGAGTLFLSGAGNAYTGTTTVNGGGLYATSLGTGAAHVASGATLALTNDNAQTIGGLSGAGTFQKTSTGALTISGSVKDFTGTLKISAGEKFTLRSDDSMDVGANDVELNVSALDFGIVRNDIIKTTGTLSIKDDATITLDAAGVVAGNYTILSSGNLAYTLSTGTLAEKITIVNTSGASGEVRELQLVSAQISDGKNLLVQLSGGIESLTWSGAGTVWEQNSANTTAFVGASDGNNAFYNGDKVTFADISSSDSQTVTIAGNVVPSEIVVNAETTNYSFSGEGSISGEVQLKKSGAGTLSISNTNSYTGGTLVTGGKIVGSAANAFGTGKIEIQNSTLQLTDADALGGSDVEFRGNSIFDGAIAAFENAGKVSILDGTTSWELGETGTLTRDIGIASNAKFSVNSSAALTFSTALSGTGTLEKTGAGNWIFNNTFNGENWSGTVAVQTGTLQFGTAKGTAAGALGTGKFSFATGTTLSINHSAGSTYNADFSFGDGTTLRIADGSTSAISASSANYIFAGTTTLGGQLNLVNSWGKSTLFTGEILDAEGAAGSISITGGSGAPNIGFMGNNTFSGGVTLNHAATSVYFDSANAFGSGDFTLKAGTLAWFNGYVGGIAGTLKLDGSGTKNLNTGSANIVFDSAISDGASSGGFTKTGAGTLTLTAENSYTGTTTISAGTLAARSANALGTSAVSLASDAKLLLEFAGNAEFSNVLSGTGTLEKTGAGELSISSEKVAGFHGAWNIQEGTKFTLTGNGSVDAGANDIALNVDQLDLGALRENIFETTGTLTLKNDAEIVLDAAGAFGSYTLLSAGTLNYEISSGTISDKITLLNTETAGERSRSLADASLENNKLTVSIAGAVSLSWSGEGATWERSDAVTNSFSGAGAGNSNAFYNRDSVTFGDISGSTEEAVEIVGDVAPATLSVNANSTNYTFSGSGSISGDVALAKSGAGTLTISNTNSYTGGTQISGGELVANARSALGTGTISVETGTLSVADAEGVFGNAIQLKDSATFNASTEAANNAGTLSAISGNSTWNVTGTAAMANAISLASGANLSVSPESSATFSGVISGAGTLTKTGAGTLVLTGTNTFTGGIVVGGGILDITSSPSTNQSSLGAATNSVTVNSGATLKLTGSRSAGFHTGTAAINGGTITMNGNDISFASGNVVTFDNGAGTIDGTGMWRRRTENNKIVVAQAGSGSVISVKTLELRDVDAVFEVQGSADFTVSSLIKSDGARGIIKTGTGTMTLSGANIYTGTTTISAGTLVAAHAKALGGNGDVLVQAGAKLRIASGVVLNKSASAVTFADGSKLVVDLSGKIGTAEETFALGLISATAFSVNGMDLAQGDVSAQMEGFYELSDAASWNKWVRSWILVDDTLSLTMTLIPEPSMFGVLVGMGALFLAGTRRRRAKVSR